MNEIRIKKENLKDILFEYGSSFSKREVVVVPSQLILGAIVESSLLVAIDGFDTYIVTNDNTKLAIINKNNLEPPFNLVCGVKNLHIIQDGKKVVKDCKIKFEIAFKLVDSYAFFKKKLIEAPFSLHYGANENYETGFLYKIRPVVERAVLEHFASGRYQPRDISQDLAGIKNDFQGKTKETCKTAGIINMEINEMGLEVDRISILDIFA